MDVPQSVAADDHEGVAEAVEPGPQPRHGLVVGLQEVDHLEGRPFAVRTVQRLVGGHARVVHAPTARRCHRVARERLGQRTEYGHEPAPARVHDTRAPQDRELSRRRVERGTGTVVRGAGHVHAVAARPAGDVRGVRSGSRHRQNRALHGVRDRLPGGLGGPAQCAPQAVPVGVFAVIRLTAGVAREDLGHAAKELREDRSGVSAGPYQCSVSHRVDDVGQRGRCGFEAREDRFHSLYRGLDGQVQIGACVPVRDGIDVDRVDLLAVPPERLQGQCAPGAHRVDVEHLRHLRLLEQPNWHRSVDPGGGPSGRGPGTATGATMVVSFYRSSRCMLLRLPDIHRAFPWHRHSDPPIRSRHAGINRKCI